MDSWIVVLNNSTTLFGLKVPLIPIKMEITMLKGENPWKKTSGFWSWTMKTASEDY